MIISPYISLTQERYNVVLLCGGKGTRLGHQSQYIPKAMSNIGESIAINLLIEQFHNVAHKYIIGSGTHAHLLESHIKGCYPTYPVVFSREVELRDTAKSFMLALDNVDSRFPTVLAYCDAINLSSPVLISDCFYTVDKTTKGHPNTYRYGIEHGSVVSFDKPKTTGLFPFWTFSDTILLKKLVYTHPEANDAMEVIRLYHDQHYMQQIPVKLCLEFGTQPDLEEVRRIWQIL